LSARHQGKDLRFPEGWLIAQIYFTVNGTAFDAKDEEVLSFIYHNYAQLLLGTRVRFQFAGYADHRSSESHNLGLSQRRAEAVKRYFDSRLGRMRSYESVGVIPRGEKFAAQKTMDEYVMAGDRRVDIFASERIFNQPTIGEMPVRGKYTGPLSQKFTFRTLKGWSFPPGVKPGVAVTYLLVEIQNSRSKKKATFKYKGGGVSLGVGFNRPTPPEERDVGVWLDVEDFEGPGKVLGAGAGRAGTSFIFEGPQIRLKSDKAVIVSFSGWDFVVGVGVDMIGSWVRQRQ